MKSLKKITPIIFVASLTFICLFACPKNSYKVDYCGQKDFYKNAKDSYREGKKVTLYYDMVATDTDYSFYLDGEYLSVKYDRNKGFVVSFVMPEHDITLRVEEKRTMVKNKDAYAEGTMLVNYYTSSYDNEDKYELVMYSGKNDTYYIEEYINGSKTPVKHEVDYEVYVDCLGIYSENKMYEWNDLDVYDCLEGKTVVFKIFDGEEYIRLSTDRMPYDGEKILEAVGNIIKSSLNK